MTINAKLETSSYIHLKEGFEGSILHIAVEDRDWHLAHTLLKHGADPNALDSTLSTPLHRACLHTDWPMIDLLNTYGARRNVRERGGYQPMNIVYSLGRGEACLLDEYDRKLNRAKALIHALDFPAYAKIDNTRVSLHSALDKAMMPHLATIFGDLRAEENGLNKAHLQEIEKAFRYGFDEVHSKQSLLRKIKSGELVFLPAGWQGHTVGICFYGGYMAICNLGEKSDEFGTVVVFAIDMEEMNEKILDRIQEVYCDFSAEDGAEVLYGEISKKLGWDLRPELELKVKPQKGPTCGFASLKASAYFAYNMLNIGRPDQDKVEAELKFLSKSIKRVAWTRNWMNGLREDSAFEISPKNRRYLDGQFTEKTASSIWKRFKKGVSKLFH